MRKNNTPRIIMMLIFLPPALIVKAQQKNYELVTEAGAGFIQASANDSLLYPGKTNGTGIQLDLRVSKTGTKRKTVLQGSYSSVQFTGDNDDPRQRGFGLSLSDGYNILSGKNKHFSLYEGWLVATQVSYSPGNASTSYSWNSYNVIGWYQSLRYSNKKNTATLDIRVPLLGVVYRTPAAASPGDKGFEHTLNSVYSHPAFASLHNNRVVDISLHYTRMVSDRLGISARYKFSYQKWEGDNPLTNISNTLGLSVGYHFR